MRAKPWGQSPSCTGVDQRRGQGTTSGERHAPDLNTVLYLRVSASAAAAECYECHDRTWGRDRKYLSGGGHLGSGGAGSLEADAACEAHRTAGACIVKHKV